MAKHMRDDGLGEWQETVIEGAHVEWRERECRAQDTHLGTDLVLDISLNGAPPVTQIGFQKTIDDSAQELELRVVQLLAG